MKTIVYFILVFIIIILFLNNIVECQQETIKEIFKNEINNVLNRNEEFLLEYQKSIGILKGYDPKKIAYYDLFFKDYEMDARKYLSQEFISQYKIFYRDELDKDLNHILDFNELKSYYQIIRNSQYSDNDILDFIKRNNNNIDFKTFLKACITFHTNFKECDPIWKYTLNDVAINRTVEMDKIAEEALGRYLRLRREYNQAMIDIDNELNTNLETFKKEYEQLTGKKLDITK